VSLTTTIEKDEYANCAVGDYGIFVQNWTEPNGGIHGYLNRFLASGDATFQHIAIWTLLQLLESGDKKLTGLISKADNIISMIKTIANLARRSLELLGKGEKPSLVEG
jgi:vacuolar protein 8